MPTPQCTFGHDHTREEVSVPLQKGRKYHCPSTAEVHRKFKGKHWKRDTLEGALKAGFEPCRCCFAA
jgi:hypothetical protein